jgi:hypothetical protein
VSQPAGRACGRRAVPCRSAASGEPAPALQWRKDGRRSTGATEATLAIAQASPSDAGLYDVVASNPSGSAASERARVDVGKRSQYISFQAPGGPLVAGQPVTLSASASSGLPVQLRGRLGPAAPHRHDADGQAGVVVVRASSRATPTYEAAPPVTQTFNFVGPGNGPLGLSGAGGSARGRPGRPRRDLGAQREGMRSANGLEGSICISCSASFWTSPGRPCETASSARW